MRIITTFNDELYAATGKALLESSERYYAAGHSLAEHGVSAEVTLDLDASAHRATQPASSALGGSSSRF